ncbi:acetate/propionate family kinase [Limisphaera sp. VF-2]|jgi:acetate kinase|uniref:acetate/propionate family kinase n=1 Tax=Limisphaera sp. VF-2 TaxID=3400418 RepID=UPI0017508F3F
MRILVANLGSTSLKWRLFDLSDGAERLLHRGALERVSDYAGAIETCLRQLAEAGHVRSDGDLAAVGFKAVVARGITGCVRVTEEVLRAMEEWNCLAPAHNPPYVLGMRLFGQRLPQVPMVALFETAFYQWAPPAAMEYAVPERWRAAGVRRLGFHGASHKYIAERSAELLGRPDVAARVRNLYVDGGRLPVSGPPLRVISCHLGGSSSVTPLRDGLALGNSLGLSPQSGLPHNNRVGDLDSFAIPLVMRTLGLSLEEVERQLCRESGLKGLSGLSNDIRDLLAAAAQGHAGARLALDVWVHSARHYIGAALAQLGGAEALVFTAGIGENQPGLRAAICEGWAELGIELDPTRNDQVRSAEARISSDRSRVQVWVIPTNEELVVAREVKRHLESCGAGGRSSALSARISATN